MPLADCANEPYKALSYCWSKSTNADFVPPDDAMIEWSYGKEEGESGQTSFKDMLDHPELHRTYMHCGGRIPPGTMTCDGVEMKIGGELHRAI